MAKTPAKKNGNAVANINEIPDYLRQDVGKGTESVRPEDIVLPRIVLLQALSDEVIEGDCKAGEFYHNIAEVSLGKTIQITPLYVDVRYILWRPRESGGGILARADDGIHWSPSSAAFDVKLPSGKSVTWRTAATVRESGLGEWGSYDPEDESSPPAATKMITIACAIKGHPELSPSLMSLQRKSLTPAGKFIGKLKTTRAPSFAQVFEVSSFLDENNNGQKFYNYKFDRVPGFLDEEEVKPMRDMYESFADHGVSIRNIEGIGDDTPAQATIDAGGPGI